MELYYFAKRVEISKLFSNNPQIRIRSENGYFDVDNFVITAKDIKGPWSRPVYLHSSGFDASMFHDEDGRKYVVSLEW